MEEIFIEQKEFEEILEEIFIEQKEFLNNILCTKYFFKRGFIEGEILEEKLGENWILKLIFKF